MACGDYITLAEVKSIVPVGALTDAAVTMLLWGAMDWLDKNILGHTFNRAVRIYEDNADSATATVAVTAAAVVVTITGGANAGVYAYTFAAYAKLYQLVDAINAEGAGVHATMLGQFTSWMAHVPSNDLTAFTAESIKGMTNWQILCLTQLTLCLDGSGEAYLFLPLRPAVVNSVIEDGTALTEGTDFYTKRDGYLIRAGEAGCNSTSLACGAPLACSCYLPGCWSCRTPCNVTVAYRPREWIPETGLITAALKGWLNVIITSSGKESEKIGRYSYTLGPAAYNALALALAPLEGEGLVVAFPL